MRSICTALVAGSIFLTGIGAPTALEGRDPVFVFNRICYAQVPNIDGIRNMARELAWRAIKGDDLKRFTTIENPSVLEGWDAQVGDRLYRVAIVQSSLSRKMKDTFPSFSEGTATSCSIVLDEQNKAEVFTANMQTQLCIQCVQGY